MSKELEDLKNLTKELVSFREISDFIPAVGGNVARVRATDSSSFLIRGLYRETGVGSCNLSFIEAGTNMQSHNHAEDEYFIVLAGCMIITFPDEKPLVLRRRDTLKVEAYKFHTATWPEDTLLIVVTIPDGEGFPNEC